MKALIIGGGISGCAAALALHHVGIQSEIHESRGQGSDGVGAFLTIAVNGVAALRLLGIDLRELRQGIDTPELQLRLGNGNTLAKFPLGQPMADGTVTRTVKRAALYAELRDRATAAGIPIHYGHTLVAAHTDGMVTAQFDDGSTAAGDILIGADGLHSVSRGIIDPTKPTPRYLGLLNTGGYAHGVTVDSPPGEMQMVFGKRAFFCYIARDNDEVWWFANPAQEREPARGELAVRTADAWKNELLGLYSKDNTPAGDLIRATEHVFSPWATYDFPNVPVWHRDRILIIGDAAHAASPSSGQGASMAIEDAVVLAKALRDKPDIDSAFAAYEQRRRERVTRIIDQGKKNGDDKAHGPIGRIIRDIALRIIFSRPPKSENNLNWMFEHILDWESPTP